MAAKRKEKVEEKEVNVGSGRYDGNTIPDSLLVSDNSDKYEYYAKNVKQLRQVLHEEYGIKLGKDGFDEFLKKARTSKYSKECIAFNKALSLMKRAFNIRVSDALISLNEIDLGLDYKILLKIADISNKKIMEAELKEKYSIRQEEDDED